MTKPDYDGPILEIDNLSISFFTRLREIPAVMDFSVTKRVYIYIYIYIYVRV